MFHGTIDLDAAKPVNDTAIPDALFERGLYWASGRGGPPMRAIFRRGVADRRISGPDEPRGRRVRGLSWFSPVHRPPAPCGHALAAATPPAAHPGPRARLPSGSALEARLLDRPGRAGRRRPVRLMSVDRPGPDASIRPYVPAEAAEAAQPVFRTPWARRWALAVLMLMAVWTAVAWQLDARRFQARADRAVAAIKAHLAFYPDRVDAIEQLDA